MGGCHYGRIFFAVEISWNIVYYNTDFVKDTFEGLTTYDTEIFIKNFLDTKWFIGSQPPSVFHRYTQPRMHFKFPDPELEPLPKPIIPKNKILIKLMSQILPETKIIKTLIKKYEEKLFKRRN